MDSEPTSSNLEQFRQQWQQEVHARNRQEINPDQLTHGRTKAESEQRVRPERPINKPTGRHPLADKSEDEPSIPESSAQGAMAEKLEQIELADADEDEFMRLGRHVPQTALEHYERAVEKEGQGSLGVSLSHYRKAFRLDENVDQLYKQKHFAHKWKQTKPVLPDAVSNDSTPVEPSRPEAAQSVPQTTAQLIASWADCEILNAPPVIEGDVPPPCPIQNLPTEVLLELFRTIAAYDVSIYARLASVCKRFAHHTHTENAIWKRVALGPEFGLASQKYHFNTDIQGRPIIWQAVEDDEEDEDERPMPLVTDDQFPADQSYRDLFHTYPRIRFTGVYISTVNYTRSGGSSVAAATWGSTMHIVTYYRYLRFFRDGTLISLLTVHAPVEVVSLLTKENLVYVRGPQDKRSTSALHFASGGALLGPDNSQNSMPPSAQNILKHALRGRWRLCHPSLETVEIGSNAAMPGDLHIETEGGAGPRYMYTMHLSLKHGNARNKVGVKNNKLIWRGFWSYNTVSGDWAEFQLRNDKAFWFSRVKSYGLGY